MARAISRDATNAFMCGDDFIRSNTYVKDNAMYLFNNCIANRRDDGNIIIRDCGWESNTTKERLNCILDHISKNYKISSSQGDWFLYLGDKKIPWNGEHEFSGKHLVR